jgi:FHA domain-containing protein
MAQRIIIRHTSGTKTHQIDEFQAGSFHEIIAGRDENAAVRFDPDREDLVSRQHLKITADPSSPGSFLVSDLQSRNGTFLNRQRLSQPTRIHHFDVVQLGPGGPEFRFELDPAPPSAARATRVVTPSEAGALARPTRESSLPAFAASATSRPIGRATVERMLDDNFGKVKKESGKTLWVGVAAIVMIVFVGLGAYLYLRNSASESAKRSEDQQALLLQMAQVVRQQPSDDAAVRAQIDKLNGDLKKIMAQNQALKQNGAASSPNGGPVSSAAKKAKEDSDSEYNAGLKRASQLSQNGDYAAAYKESVRIIGLDGSRWEGYFIAGSSLTALNQPGAQPLFQYALAQAPEADKARIAQRISQLQGGGSGSTEYP